MTETASDFEEFKVRVLWLFSFALFNYIIVIGTF